MLPKASLYDLVGDLVIYRNLDPLDARLPRFAGAWREMGLSGPARPRKVDPEYAQALAWFIRRAQAMRNCDAEIKEIVFVGDTFLSDRGAFLNLRAAGGWRGWAFIGAERDEVESVTKSEGVCVANRWSALAEFIRWMQAEGASLDQRTAVLLDIDKTVLAARGRNDRAIDRARVAAIEATIAETLGDEFDQALFRRAYIELNIPRYHAFTADNQDYLAYICLMLGAGVSRLESLLEDLNSGDLNSFRQFMDQIETQSEQLPGERLRSLHDDIYSLVKAGDPTPFKRFRQREFEETADRMGCLPDDAPLAQRMMEEICMTLEVEQIARWLRARGCLMMASSDKPDEATMPTADSESRGYRPLHRITTHLVGQDIEAELP